MSLNKKRVLVGMSGGIDSTATCMMLQEQGFEVVGVTMHVWDSPNFTKTINEAKELAKRLNIEHHVADERSDFSKVIVKYFIDEYKQGRTPNPCVMCNPLFKFRVLSEWADKLDCYFIATGHYTKLLNKEDKTFIVAGKDEKKDQSYFLWQVSQDILKRTIFPLGDYTKNEVREYLHEKGLTHKAKEGESMEVCFIEGDYRDFLRKHSPDIDKEIGEGWFVDAKGVKLGKHLGCPYYTIGQRKGLNIALGKPAYVTKINPEKNTVMLGDADQLKAKYMIAEKDKMVAEEELFKNPNLTVRIRYRSKPLACKVARMADSRLLIKFKDEASAVTPGQSAVFYEGDRVIGGAFIASQKGLYYITQQLENI